jgi:putative transposase
MLWSKRCMIAAPFTKVASFITPTAPLMVCKQTTAGQWDGQYLSIRYTERLALAGIEPSVGSVGDAYDNALAETINGLYKAEVIHRLGPWKTIAAVEWETPKWVDWFDNRRLLEPIGYIPPAEAEERYYAQFNPLDMVA